MAFILTLSVYITFHAVFQLWVAHMKICDKQMSSPTQLSVQTLKVTKWSFSLVWLLGKGYFHAGAFTHICEDSDSHTQRWLVRANRVSAETLPPLQSSQPTRSVTVWHLDGDIEYIIHNCVLISVSSFSSSSSIESGLLHHHVSTTAQNGHWL